MHVEDVCRTVRLVNAATASLVSMHHMVGDGGSISLMIHELWAAYLDRSSELPKPARPVWGLRDMAASTAGA